MKNYLNKIFIVHYTKLEDRKKHMLSEMQRWVADTPYEFMEDHDQEQVTQLDIIDYFDMNTFRLKHSREMKRGEISLCIKYQNILKKIVEEEEGDYFLILEDDVIFKEDPHAYINRVIEMCNAQNIDFDCVFMGEAALRVGDNRDVFFQKPYPSTNGLCTVLYKRETIVKLYESMCKYRITEPLDWEFNKRFRDLDFKIFWGKAITEHGSVTAVHDASLSGLKSCLREVY